MSLHKKILYGGGQLGVCQAITQVCALGRNVIIGRVISPADFGIAATFAITLTFLESISDLALDKLVVQSANGDDEHFQSLLQLLLVWRGTAIGVCIAAIAPLVASLFGVPGATWAFRCLALVPFMRGFLHLDVYRAQRHMEFWPMIRVELGAAVLSTIVAVPLVLWLRSYAAMLWVILLQAALTVILSHCLATRHYRWRWDSVMARSSLQFGWPLLVNGFLLFIVFQGDRFVIGAANKMFGRSIYSLAELGAYSAAFTLTVIPTGIVAKVCGSLFLPVFSRPADTGTDFDLVYASCSQLCAVTSGLSALLFVLVGGWVTVLIYGPGYGAAQQVIGLLALTQALRVARITPTIAAMARGDTMNAMLSNLWRLFSISAILFVAWRGMGLAWIAAMGLMGEMLALGYSVWHLYRKHHLAPGICLKPAFGVGCFLCAAAAVSPVLAGVAPVLRVTSTALVFALYLGAASWGFPALRRSLLSHAWFPPKIA